MTTWETIEPIVTLAGHYGPGGQHAIVPIPNSHWLIVDSWYANGKIVGLGIHLDADDPNYAPLSPDLWLHDGTTHANALALRHTKALRLALRRATTTAVDDSLRPAEERAEAHLALAKARRQSPTTKAVTITFGRYTIGHVKP